VPGIRAGELQSFYGQLVERTVAMTRSRPPGRDPRQPGAERVGEEGRASSGAVGVVSGNPPPHYQAQVFAHGAHDG